MEAASPAPHDCGRSFRFLVLPVARPLAFCLTFAWSASSLVLSGLPTLWSPWCRPHRQLPRSAMLPSSSVLLRGRTAQSSSCTNQVRRGPRTLRPSSLTARASWTWRVGSRTTPGRWPIVVTCAKGADRGELKTAFQVG